MAQQSSNGNRPKLSEKGLLTPDNCVVALIDHQGQMLFGTSNFDRQGIINNTVAFGKATRVFDVPVVLTTVEAKSFSGNMWPQLRAVFPGKEPIECSSMNYWDDKNLRRDRKAIVALLVLLGMVLGEQFGIWIQTKKLDVSRAASGCLVGERYDRQLYNPPSRKTHYPGSSIFAEHIAKTDEVDTRDIHSE